MRNSSLVKRSRAENVTGLSIAPKIWMSQYVISQSVFEHFHSRSDSERASKFSKNYTVLWNDILGRGRGALILHRSRIVRFGGAVSSENAGMSNHKAGENPARRKSKVSWATVIVPGLVGPKPRRVA